MRDDDRGYPQSEIPDQPSELELQLAEYDWSKPLKADEVSFDDVKHALAVLAVMDLEDDEDFEQYGSLWLH